MATVGDEDEQKLWLAVVGAETVPHGLMEKSSIPIPSSDPLMSGSLHRMKKVEPLDIVNTVIISEIDKL